jgi:hypothetical protein
MTDFAVLPAQGYQLIHVDENDCEPVETRLSTPEPVLGFAIRCSENGVFHGPYPITTSGVEDGTERYALIRPDHEIEYVYGGRVVFDSFDAFKQHLRRDAAELYRELAEDTRKAGDGNAAEFARLAKKLARVAAEHEDEKG